MTCTFVGTHGEYENVNSTNTIILNLQAANKSTNKKDVRWLDLQGVSEKTPHFGFADFSAF